MVAALLLFCVMVPWFWRHDANADGMAASHGRQARASVQFIAREGEDFPGFRIVGGVGAPSTNGLPTSEDLLALFGPPTIEQLLAAHVESNCLGPDWTAGGFHNWATLPIPTNSGPRFDVAAESRTADPELIAAYQSIGQALARFVPARVLPDLVCDASDIYQRWCAETTATPGWRSAHPNSTLRVLGPNDRLAMLPGHELSPSSGATAWCVPRTLYEQLERLANQPFSANWAQRVLDNLHSLADRDRLEGADVEPSLAQLGELAGDAVRLADAADDDRMRVELLRAHWALARRLDCWTLMYEMRVAFRSQGRLASRDTAGAYFNGAPEATTPPADGPVLMKDLEAYETSRDPRLGRQIVEEQRSLAASPNSLDRALAEAVEQHYRNANVRVAITAEMLNRLVRPPQSESRPLRDVFAGVAVRGESHVRSDNRVELSPADGQWKLNVEANGVVESNTLADTGPVRFRSRGATEFSAHKQVVVDPDGIQFKKTDVDATCKNRLTGVTTDYDWMPLVGGYTRDRAVSEYQARQRRAKNEIESRVEYQTRETLDAKTREAVEEVRSQVYDRFTAHFNEYGIELTPVEIKTTDERVLARLRVAGQQQLGSHTPRPRALSDSLASLQIHESALTNAAITLGLDGKRYTAPELQHLLREKFTQIALKNPPVARPDTVFQFAAEDAVKFHIANSRLEMTIALAEMELDGHKMRDVFVHAYYAPVVDGLNADLVREGALGIEGRFSSSDRARLHNVFNTVLPPERRLPIVRIQNPHDPRVEGLMITQLVLEDGWVGLAVGPTSSNRVAERSRSLR
jgi:hypothetical protein